MHFTEFKIQNMVGSCDVRFPIRLEGIACKHSHYSSYEPELFPGLIYRMVRGRDQRFRDCEREKRREGLRTKRRLRLR